MASRLLRLVFAAALIVGAFAPAHAANSQLEQARAKYRDLDYQPLPALLAEALLQPGNTREDYLEIYKLQGFTYTVLGDQQKAREAFTRLLTIDPNYDMDVGVSPRFRTVFNEVKKAFKKRGEVTLQHEPISSAKVGEGFEVAVSLKDVFGRAQKGVAKVRAVIGGQEGAYVDVPLEHVSADQEGVHLFKGRLPDPASSIPGEKPRGYFVDYAFTFHNMVGVPVEVSGGKPSWRVTVGDPKEAAKKVTPGGPKEEAGGPNFVVPVLIAGALAGVAVVGIVVVLGGGAAATGAGLGACYYLGPCNPDPEAQFGRVNVVVTR